MSDETNMEMSILRTNLSNTRTMLSHTKASIGLVISALGFMKLFDSYLIFDLCGWVFIFWPWLFLSRESYISVKQKAAYVRYPAGFK